MQGFINIYKPSGITSAYVVSKVKKHLNTKKVGHMGTLDPLASGVLPIAIGKATRMFDYFLEKNKTYVAVFKFGYETDTLDSDGVVTNKTDNTPNKEDILDALPNLTGELLQMPPKYSAKKIKGKKAYELAREGIEFTLKTKQIEVHEFRLIEQIDDYSFKFLIDCSSGTYIRSLGRDLGYEVNSLATMTSLERVESGFFNTENAISLDDFVNLPKEQAEQKIIKINKVFSHYENIYLNETSFNKLKNGVSINLLTLIDNDLTKNNVTQENLENCENIFVFSDNNILLGVARSENNILKIKTFLLENN